MAGSSGSVDGDVTGNHGSSDFWVVKLGGSILPVTLLSFTGVQNNRHVLLKWQTATEQNSAYFEVEKSQDGIRFTSLANVNAAGNSQSEKNYYYTDNNPAKGNNFYRLKQVDLDRRFTYSPVIRVSNNGSKLTFSLSPNPAKDAVNIIYNGGREQVSITIYDAQGKLVKQRTAKNDSPIIVSIQELKAGMYFIHLSDGEIVQKGKFVK